MVRHCYRDPVRPFSRAETESTRTWLKHLLCVSRLATCLDQLASNTAFNHMHQAKTLSDKFGTEACFQSCLIRVDLAVHSVLARMSRQWPLDHGTVARELFGFAQDYEYLCRVFPEMDKSSRALLSERANMCGSLADQVGSIQANREMLASLAAPLRTLPVYHFVTGPDWSLNMLITPISTTDQPIIVTNGMDVTYHVYGQVMHRKAATMLPVISEGQLVVVVSLRPLFQSLRRDLTKQRQVSECAQLVDSAPQQQQQLDSLSISSLLVLPLALHANTFSKPAAIPFTALDSAGGQSQLHVTLLVRLKLPSHLSGGWWECGPMASMVIAPRSTAVVR
ncbi:hypothetical protein BCR44DRAFT_1083802 [Catenaria anguillulae PL171]|uniref:Uncharacterized protein n=1 Tax=Catenaria anguillulae PL171 TaxID=765915 RepID=A0A1Y2HNL2_9FUNG|nr:hypothetical protein BCR44DRAFT_1083802 [Catenaria anguillulae PL171]